MNLKTKQFIDTFIGLPLVYLNVIAAKILGFLLNRNHQLQQPPSEIVIIKLLGFGSVIMASDAIHSIKLKYPNTMLSIVCSKSIEEGVRSLGLFDMVYVIADESLLKTCWSSFKIIRRLQQVKHLWTLDLEVYSKLTSVFALWTLAQNRIGFYFNQVAFRFHLNTHNIYFNDHIQVEENYQQMIKAIGVLQISHFYIKGYEVKNSSTAFKYIAINNTCSELAPERKLSNTQLKEICAWIFKETTFHIALLGAPSDKESNEVFIQNNCAEYLHRIKNMAGTLRFSEYYHFLYHQCKLMITIDSAPLHIANKLSLLNLSIWGPTAPQTRIDTEVGNEFLYLQASCSPCAHFTNKLPCNGEAFCMKNISSNQIIEKIKKLIA